MRQIGARLYGTGGDAVAANSFFDNDVRLLKDLVDAVRGKMIFVNDVAADVFVNTS